jgi:hypothetical protein
LHPMIEFDVGCANQATNATFQFEYFWTNSYHQWPSEKN